MQKICVFLENPIHTDGRVIKLIRKLSEKNEVYLFYHGGSHTDQQLFSNKVHLYTVDYPRGWQATLLRHSLFYQLHHNLLRHALNCGITFDYVWCNDLTTLALGVKLKSLQACKLIYDSHEIYLETLNQFFPSNVTGIKKAVFNTILYFMRWMGERAERNCLKQVDVFVTVNQSLVDYFKAKYAFTKSIHIIMNCPLKLEAGSLPPIDYRRQYGWQNDDFIFILQGSLNAGRGIERLMRIIPLCGANLKFVFVGRGPLYKTIEQWIVNYKLENRVKIFHTTAAEILAHCAAADCGINLLEPINQSKAFTSATKLFEYIQVGIPSICSNVIENKRIYDKYNIGLLIENNDAELKEAIHRISTVQLDKFKEQNRLAATEYCWENQVGIIDSFIH